MGARVLDGGVAAAQAQSLARELRPHQPRTRRGAGAWAGSTGEQTVSCAGAGYSAGVGTR